MNTFARLPDETHLEFILRRARVKADARDRLQPLVTPEAESHGDYRDVTLFDVNEAGAPVRVAAKRNHGGDAIDRWEHKGKLNDPQLAAIKLCRRLWRRAGINQSVTSNYGERIVSTGSAEHYALAEIDARDELHRIQDYIPAPYWDVFENIARHALPVGETAAVAGYTGPGAEIRAHTVVCFVADIIAMNERL